MKLIKRSQLRKHLKTAPFSKLRKKLKRTLTRKPWSTLLFHKSKKRSKSTSKLLAIIKTSQKLRLSRKWLMRIKRRRLSLSKVEMFQTLVASGLFLNMPPKLIVKNSSTTSLAHSLISSRRMKTRKLSLNQSMSKVRKL